MSEPTSGNSSFTSTRWTIVRRARGSSEEGRQALAELCRTYWLPVSRFLRCEGRSEDEAGELTQEFFARLLQKGRLGAATPEIGRFRAYLLGAVKHFLADQRKAAQRQKRGGGIVHQSLDTDARSKLQVPDPTTSFDETYFDQQWAYALLARVLARLEDGFRRKGRLQEFELLKPWLTGGAETGAKQAAMEQLAMSEGALKVAIHRIRKRYRVLVREEIADTVASEVEVEGELRYLISVISRHS